MRKEFRVLFWTCFLCAAVLLSAAALVERPALLMAADAESRLPAPPVTCAGLSAQPCTLPEAPADAAAQTRAELIRSCLPDEDASMLPADSVSRDGNGYPLTGCSYVKTVYTAFPLQDMPG